MSKSFKKKQNYLNPLTNVYSSKELPSYLNIRHKNNIIKKNAFLLNSLQNKPSFDRINYNSIKMKDLERYPTQKNLRRINVNAQKNDNYVFPEDDNIIFAKKRNMYTGNNNNGKMNANANGKNLKNLNINNDMIAKKIQNKYKEGIRKYQKISNYNPKYFSINNNGNNLSNNLNINSNIYLDKNNVNINKSNALLKRNSNNLIRYNNNSNDLNSTMPNQTIKSHNFMPNLSTNNNIMPNIIDSNDKKSSINQNKNNILNDSFKLESQYLTNRQRNRGYKFTNYRTNTEYKNKNRNLKNDLSWDYGIGILNKGNSGNFYKKINKNYLLSNHLSERKKNFVEIESDILNDNDDIDDKEIDEIVDNLEDFFNEDRINKTVILDNKGFSDDSLSDIADDIVKTFQENENENEMDLNFQKNIPSSSNPEVDGTTSSGNDFQNNNIQNQKNTFYENKSAAKPTIVNNFFISSSDSLNQNKSLEKDINYNLVIVNEYNNKINSNVNTNLPIPSLVSKTYKSPNILREEKNNLNINRKLNDLYDNIAESENTEISDNNLMKNQNVKQNILIGLNYSNNINNNTTIGSNINNNMNNQINPSNYFEGNNINNNNFSNNFNKTYGMNNNYLFNMNKNNSLKKNSIKNNNESKIIDSTLKEILSSNKNKPNNIINNNNINSLNNQYQDLDNLDNTNFSFNKNININQNNNITNDSNNNSNNYKGNIYNNAINSNNLNVGNMTSIGQNNNNYFNYNNNNNVISNNILTKNKKHISFNFNNNIYIKFRTEDLITQSQITNQNGGVYHHKEKDMNLYQNELKMIKPRPIIKTFLAKDIKINHEYNLVENLPERQILPDLYDDFEEDDIKSLEKSLEKSVDKILH